MTQLNIDISNAIPFVDPLILRKFEQELVLQHQVLLDGSGRGSEFLGWMKLPLYDPETIRRIRDDARKIQYSSQVLVVTGIGGSYLGARAVIDALGGNRHSNPL